MQSQSEFYLICALLLNSLQEGLGSNSAKRNPANEESHPNHLQTQALRT